MSLDRVYINHYDVDRRSVFIGNLPMNTTKEELYRLFEHYGAIKDIMLRETVSQLKGMSDFLSYVASNFDSFVATEKFCFAFVEFQSPDSVERAINDKVFQFLLLLSKLY